MKQFSTKILAISALVIAGFSATAQSNGQRNMTKRDAGNQQAPANQGNVAYGNGNQGSQYGNRNDQYNSGNNDSRTGQYNRGNSNDQYGNRDQSFDRNNDRRQQGGRQEESYGRHRPLLKIFFGNRRDDRRDEYSRGRDYRRYDDHRRHW